LLTSSCQQPENILLFSPGPYPRIQIADFGLARPKAYQETLHVCGTISYLPPEGILALEHKHLGYVGMPADCWSAGVTLFAMLTCVFFNRESCPDLINALINEAAATHSILRVLLGLAFPLATWTLRASFCHNMRRLKMKEQSNAFSMGKYSFMNRSGVRFEMVRAG
jgi:serine/threonine protein kinase